PSTHRDPARTRPIGAVTGDVSGASARFVDRSQPPEKQNISTLAADRRSLRRVGTAHNHMIEWWAVPPLQNYRRDETEAPVMRVPRVRLTVRRIMVAVVLVAPVFLSLRDDLSSVAPLLGAAFCGALSQAPRGLRVVLGGVVGGVAFVWLVVLRIYVRSYL